MEVEVIKQQASFRKAQPEDAREIALVQIAAWQVAYQDILPVEFLEGMTVDKCTANWTSALTTDNPGQYIVVEQNKRIVGFACFGPARDKDLTSGKNAELVGINLLPALWHKGIGSGLLVHIIQQLQSSYNHLYLWVALDNQNAINFYRKHGFSADGNTKQTPQHAHIIEQRMQLEINKSAIHNA